MTRPHPETISPTAHYTGYVWYANGESHDAFATRAGRNMYRVMQGPDAIGRTFGFPSLERMLLARHRLIDLRLARAIDAGEIQQVVEVAAGLSPRGWRFTKRYGERLTYIETDLPGMVVHKHEILEKLGGETAHHKTAEINALADEGPESIAAICATLDPTKGTAIISEGLLNYFDRETVLGMWRRFASALQRFPNGLYLSDLVLSEGNRGVTTSALSWVISTFVRGSVHMPFETSEQAVAGLAETGMYGELHAPCDFASEIEKFEPVSANRIRIIEAAVRPATRAS